MRILVLNGSPKGKNSVTLQTVEYLKLLFPEHEYVTLDVGKTIRAIEKDFSASKAALEAADLIVFCYPVYTFLVPAQLHRFIELIKENDVNLTGKWATQITTSKHFYDITAHRFIQDNCADLQLRYLKGLSADMEDILSEKGQREAEAFFRFVTWNKENGFCEPSRACAGDSAFEPAIASEVVSSPDPAFEPAIAAEVASNDDPAPERAIGSTAPSSDTEGKGGMHVALVTDYDESAALGALQAMIRRFEAVFEGSCELINLRTFPFKGGCLGCFNCASDGTCIYRDGFDSFLREHINGADAVVYAYTIADHSMGYRFKLYDDRQFCNGHRTVTMGKPVGYLVDGCLSAEENQRVLMEARAQVGGNYLAGVATDEHDPDAEIDQMAKTLGYAIANGYEQPKNFYGVGGLKIFRDLIYQMQGLMKEDHRFYKKHGFYDFPQKRKGTIVGMYLVSALMKNKKLQKKSKISMVDGMMMSYHKALEKAEKREKRHARQEKKRK